MKKIILLLILSIFITSCFSNKQDVIKNNENQEILNNWSWEELISNSQNIVEQWEQSASWELDIISEQF